MTIGPDPNPNPNPNPYVMERPVLECCGLSRLWTGSAGVYAVLWKNTQP